MIFTVVVSIGFWMNPEKSEMRFAHLRAAFRSEEEANAWGYDAPARIGEEQVENVSVFGCPVGQYSFKVEEFPLY